MARNRLANEKRMIIKVKITFDELIEAYGIYRRISRSPRNKNTVREFCLFLGGEGLDEELWEEVYKYSEVTEDVAKKLKWLKSPNVKTLYKAWCVRNANNT